MADEPIATGYLRLVPEVDGIQKTLGGTFAAAGQDSGRKFGASFLPSLKGLLAAAGGLLIAREVKDFVAEGVAALSKIETINAQTANVIKSTGGAAKVSAVEVEALAGALERKTATEAESIQQGANLLLTFKNIRNEAGAGNDIFNQTVASMVDVARAMGTDAAGGAVQLGKALNDPIAGIAALARVGITFTDEQKKLIKSLVESGDLLSAQKIILNELNSQFGGSGAAYAETYAGKVELMANAYGDLQENIVGGVMPALGQFAGLATDVLTRLNDSPALAGFIGKINAGADGLVAQSALIIGIIDKVSASPQGFTIAGFVAELEAAMPFLTPFFDVLNAVTPLLPALSDAFAQIAPALADAIPGLASLVLELLPLIPILAPPLVDLLTAVAQIITDAGPYLDDFAGFVADLLSNLPGMLKYLDDAFSTMTDAQIMAKGLAGSYGAFIKDLFEGIDKANKKTKDSLNALIGLINGAIGGLNDLNNGFVGLFGGTARNTPKIPKLAKGGTATRPGWAVVGDAGPELINMNVGAQVRPLGNLGDAVGGGGVHIGTIVAPDQDPRVSGRMMADEILDALAGTI